jgi:catechol 2,3-dioxygenase-like lactoylglutathione lyase family enzyme
MRSESQASKSMFLYAHHVTYVVYNIREMADFLEKNFGMKPWKADEFPKYGLRVLVYKVGQTLMEFMEPMLDEGGNPAMDGLAVKMFADMLRETGPGLFHVAWAVDGIDALYKDLKGKGNDMDARGHDHPLHDSFHKWYKVFNVLPHSIGPSYANAVRGVFFQCAEGVPGGEDLAERGNLDLKTLPEHSNRPPGGRIVRS